MIVRVPKPGEEGIIKITKSALCYNPSQMAASKVKQGDKVSWNWGGGAPAGTVAETKDEGEIAIQSKRGNTIKKNASPDDPAVHVERSGNDVVKRASELTVQEKAPMNKLDDGGERHDSKKRKPEEREGLGDDDDGNKIASAKCSKTEEPHEVNKRGKEVKKGGKDPNKRQKIRQDDNDVKDITYNLRALKRERKDDGDGAKDEGDEGVEKEEKEGKDNKPKQANTSTKPAHMEKARTRQSQGESELPCTSEADVKDDPKLGMEQDDVSTRTRSHDIET
ncbi:putative hmg-i hmg-y DNA-binding conserved site protein [Rosellinia necatrix]|uniref:Putative hmg-i hmg-y DNA-binding conserved site protein n=1 Tax=Rosellinia necatrix TaxID=77044 RepID=A0A1S7UNU8_ROSNE|nr:putative hmg-i hmg-y DNA-binding conserved site protein [Rosellinia necatrix]